MRIYTNLTYFILSICFISLMSCQNNEKKVCLNDNTNSYLQVKNASESKGTILFIGDYENDSIINFINSEGFDVASLKSNSITVSDVTKAYQLIKSNEKLKLQTNYIGIIGCSDNAKFAALCMNKLSEKEQPTDLILINPKGFDATIQGTVFPAINPPYVLKTKLLCIADNSQLSKTDLLASSEYTKTWIGYDGDAFYREITNNKDLLGTLKEFFNGQMITKKYEENPAAQPVEGYFPQRHAEKLELVKNHKYDLIFVGNSITNNFEKPEYQPVWNKYFAPRNALNLGYSGYRTENIIWNLQEGELEGQSPKVIVLLIGTNNIDEKNYPTRHTAGQLAEGTEKIVDILREKCPDSKIILLRCFPGCYGGPNPTSHRRILERASDIVSHIADNKHIFYCDVNHVFLNMDGSINHDMLGDWLHPTPAGAKAWAQAMEPLLSTLMDDKSRDNELPENSAIIPASKLEDDSYDWWIRHNDVLKVKDSLNPEIVLIGNSITHFWGGKYPALKYADGTSREPNGPISWAATFGKHRVLNLGFGWDRTQNVLWRLDYGELDALNPQLVVIHLGTNNTSETKNARANTAPEIVEGVKAVCLRVRSKIPYAKIVLMQIFPREEMPDNPRRILINKTNILLEKFAEENNITLLDISDEMLTDDGILTKELTFDFCHPTDSGYQIWGEALKPFIN